MVTFDKIYNSLPLPSMNDLKVKQTQNTADLIEAIKNSHNENLKFAKKIAPMFRGVNNFQTGSNIFNFLKTYIPYHVEPAARQTTRTLPRMLHDAAGGIGSDCKHYSVFTGTILESLKIPFKYRLASYNSEYPQHIYTVICDGRKEIIVDAVLSNYNTEKKPLKKYDMSLYKLSGVEIGNTAKNKRLAKKIVEKTKTVGLAIPRNAFLLLVDFNIFGLATKLKKVNDFAGDAGLKFWSQFGGKIEALKKAIAKGAVKKPIASIHGVDDLQGMGVAGELAASFAAALPIIIKVIDLFKNMKIPTDGIDTTADAAKTDFEAATGSKFSDTVFKQEAGSDKTGTVLTKNDAIQTTQSDADKIAEYKAQQAEKSTDGKSRNFMGVPIKYLAIGGGILLVGGIAYAMNKKSK
jgi:hypothetical protein